MDDLTNSPLSGTPVAEWADPISSQDLCQNSFREFWHIWLAQPGYGYAAGPSASIGPNTVLTRAPSTRSRHRIARLATRARVSGPGVLTRPAEVDTRQDCASAWQLSRGTGSLCQGLLDPVVWREPHGKSLSMGPLVEALEAAQGRIRDAIGYLYLMQLSPSSRRP